MDLPHTSAKVQRRSTRIQFRSQILISGIDDVGVPLRTEGETVQISLHGARIRSRLPLHLGMQIRLKMRNRGEWQMARVVWARPAEGEYGIQLSVPGAFWGITFQPRRQLPPAIARVINFGTQAGSPDVQQSPDGEAMSPMALTAASPHDCSATMAASVAGGPMRVLVTGISILRNPFQESTVLEPTDGNEAVLSITGLVEIGARLRLVVPAHDRVLTVRVKKTSAIRQGNKWRLWVELPRAL